MCRGLLRVIFHKDFTSGFHFTPSGIYTLRPHACHDFVVFSAVCCRENRAALSLQLLLCSSRHSLGFGPVCLCIGLLMLLSGFAFWDKCEWEKAKKSNHYPTSLEQQPLTFVILPLPTVLLWNDQAVQHILLEPQVQHVGHEILCQYKFANVAWSGTHARKMISTPSHYPFKEEPKKSD
ncbi:hypothetical protein GGX14DRAFT_400206 [Mycena pura]|uniref:Uncharacterized protein n=1 Tax=Mycena pura TaxID=153505 RepID=A0AAD6Y9L8_9AGAR|nr:hypothetical protein GGX14DRAFT_400206 [Mycena pura]